MSLREIKIDHAQEYAQQSSRCGVTCLETFHYCLSKGQAHAAPAHLRLLQDGARICAATSDFLAGDSFYRTELAMICSEICEACALTCEQFEDDEQMRSCAESCLQWATACRRISVELAA